MTVLHHSDPSLLDIVLTSVQLQRYQDYEIVVIDDASQDGSAQHLAHRWPDVRVVRTAELPVGITSALNCAVAHARGEFIALLNNDLELDRDWLALMVEALDEHPEAASASGKMLNYHRRDRLDGAGDLLRWSGAATHRGFGERDTGQFDQAEEVFAPCAGAALVRRAAFDVVGLFDEDFFAYQEDVDWGLRARLAGFSSWYEPRARAYHMGGATTRREHDRYAVLQRRNQILLVIKDYPFAAMVRHAPEIVSGQLAQLLEGCTTGDWRLQVEAWAQVVPRLPSTLRKRRRVQRSRRVCLAELDHVMSPGLYAGQGLCQRLKAVGRLARRSSAPVA